MKEERLQILQRMPIFGGIREDILELLLNDAAVRVISEGEFLFREGDPGDAMYVLETGSVAILKAWKGTCYRLGDLTDGDCVGEMSMIDLGRRSASVLAMTRCKAIELTNAAIFKLYQWDLEQFSLIQMNISRELSRRLRIADEALFRELVQEKQIVPL
jgi:CRP-like cAMP-binding protein